ncbi:Serine/arginine-rich splicing factor 4, partial [Ophiophagus hannah]
RSRSRSPPTKVSDSRSAHVRAPREGHSQKEEGRSRATRRKIPWRPVTRSPRRAVVDGSPRNRSEIEQPEKGGESREDGTGKKTNHASRCDVTVRPMEYCSDVIVCVVGVGNGGCWGMEDKEGSSPKQVEVHSLLAGAFWELNDTPLGKPGKLVNAQDVVQAGNDSPQMALLQGDQTLLPILHWLTRNTMKQL